MSLTSKQIDELRAYAADRKGDLAKLINDAADTIEMLSAKLHASQMERSSQYYHDGWIPCSERLPENRVDVLVCYREWQKYAKRYVYAIVNGWYARKYSVRENVFSEWEMDSSDYKEDEDEFYIPEGWYEFTTQGNGDLMNWFINAEVIAWMPLPEPYQGGNE